MPAIGQSHEVARLQGAHQDHEAPLGRGRQRFGARHELYEMNYAGSHELVRLFPLYLAQASGSLQEMEAMVER